MCRESVEAKVRALPQWRDMESGRFLGLMANTLKERTWIVQKKLGGEDCQGTAVAPQPDTSDAAPDNNGCKSSTL